MRTERLRGVFVVGAGRSGTSALCQALSCHSRMMMSPGEAAMTHEISQLATSYRRGGTYYSESTGMPERRVRTRIRSLCLDSIWGDSVATTLARCEAMPGFAEKDWSSMQAWGAKAFPDFPAAEGLEWLFPEARYVYIFRNGLDVVYSMSKYPGFSNLSFEQRCSFWADNARRYTWMLQDKRTIVIRFEDFLNDPDEILTRILAHVHLPYESGPTEFASTTLVHPLDQPTVAANPRSLLNLRAAVHQDWSSHERRVFGDVCSEGMELLGYQEQLDAVAS